MWESIRFCGTLFVMKVERNTFKCYVGDKNKLNINILFHMIQYFKTF